MPWIKDLSYGEEKETIIHKKYPNIIEICKDKRYDFRTNKYKYEVKADRLCIKTGNLFIEFASRKKESGIKTTEADYWIFYIDGKNIAYEIKTEVLLDLINKKKYWKIVSGGDRWTSRGYLFKLDLIKKHSKELIL